MVPDMDGGLRDQGAMTHPHLGADDDLVLAARLGDVDDAVGAGDDRGEVVEDETTIEVGELDKEMEQLHRNEDMVVFQ